MLVFVVNGNCQFPMIIFDVRHERQLPLGLEGEVQHARIKNRFPVSAERINLFEKH